MFVRSGGCRGKALASRLASYGWCRGHCHNERADWHCFADSKKRRSCRDSQGSRYGRFPWQEFRRSRERSWEGPLARLCALCVFEVLGSGTTINWRRATWKKVARREALPFAVVLLLRVAGFREGLEGVGRGGQANRRGKSKAPQRSLSRCVDAIRFLEKGFLQGQASLRRTPLAAACV